MTRALFEARSLTLLDAMIRVGYRGQKRRWLRNALGVSIETVNHERDTSGRFASCWRSLTRHRVTVCCDYGNAWMRPNAIY